MANIAVELLLLALSLVAIILGADAFRNIAKGKAQTLSRSSTRVYSRIEEPRNFWLTIATQMIWLFLGLFLFAISVGGMLGLL